MIRKAITLHDYNWDIYAYFSVTTYYIDEIMELLWRVGVDSSNAERAYKNMSSGQLNTGLCYSNYKDRCSVIVVAKTTNASEFLNSLTHEVTHACVHIAKYRGIDIESEEFAYLVGDLCEAMYNDVKHLLCEHCRCNNN